MILLLLLLLIGFFAAHARSIVESNFHAAQERFERLVVQQLVQTAINNVITASDEDRLDNGAGRKGQQHRRRYSAAEKIAALSVLDEARDAMDETQLELASRVTGVSKSCLSKWRKNRYEGL